MVECLEESLMPESKMIFEILRREMFSKTRSLTFTLDFS